MRVKPAVLLVHGAGSSFEHNYRRTGWVDLLEEAGRTVLDYDLPGHGSAALATYENGEQIVDELLSRLAGHETVDAVGFSAGAQLLAATVARAPARFSRLVLLGVGKNILEPYPAGPVRLASAIADETDPTGRLFRRMARSAGNDVENVQRYLLVPKPAVDPAALGRVTARVLVALGDKDYNIPADGLAAAFPDAELRVFPGVDHFALASDVRCLDVVLSFLAADD